MKRITRFSALGTISIILATGVAVAAALTHAVGATAADVSAIKLAVTQLRHGVPFNVSWYIAVNGPYAVAYDGCSPGACNETQLFRRNGHWAVTCYTVEGKGRFGKCLTPANKIQRLRRAALSSYHSS